MPPLMRCLRRVFSLPLGSPLVALCLLAAALAGCAGPRPVPVSPLVRGMAGQMLLVGFRGAEPGLGAAGELPILRQVVELNLGGVILFDRDVAAGNAERNIRTPEQVARLNAALSTVAREAAMLPLFIALDQEGGRVQRLKPIHGFPDSPAAAQLCPGGDSALAFATGRAVGGTVASVGFNLDFAPVADVNVNPANPVIGGIGRSFSADPHAVAFCAGAFADGLHESGVLTAAKHFPGHGSSTTDSHLGFTDVTSTWTEAELIPFRALMATGQADMIMTAHVFNAHLDPKYPATLSRAVIGGLLRGSMGYDGVVVTDDMQMRAVSAHYGLKEAIRLSIDAGADILLFGNNLEYDPKLPEKALAIIVELVAEGQVSPERIRQSWKRIQTLKSHLNGAAGG